MTVACSMASFWVLLSGAPWRDQPETYGPRITCYNRFVRWRRAGVWDQIMDALAAGHDAAVQMIDTSVVRVHRHGALYRVQQSPRDGSLAGLTSKNLRWWTPMACWSISLLRRVKRMTIRCVRFFSAPCFHKRCYSRIVDTTRTGSSQPFDRSTLRGTGPSFPVAWQAMMGGRRG